MWLSAGPPPNSRERRNSQQRKHHQAAPETKAHRQQKKRGCVKIGASSFYISLIAVMSCFLWLMAVFLFFDRVTPKCILRGV